MGIIRKGPSDSHDKALASALHWLFQEFLLGLKVKFVTSHTHTHTHSLSLSLSISKAGAGPATSTTLPQCLTARTGPLSPPLPIPQHAKK